MEVQGKLSLNDYNSKIFEWSNNVGNLQKREKFRELNNSSYDYKDFRIGYNHNTFSNTNVYNRESTSNSLYSYQTYGVSYGTKVKGTEDSNSKYDNNFEVDKVYGKTQQITNNENKRTFAFVQGEEVDFNFHRKIVERDSIRNRDSYITTSYRRHSSYNNMYVENPVNRGIIGDSTISYFKELNSDNRNEVIISEGILPKDLSIGLIRSEIIYIEKEIENIENEISNIESMSRKIREAFKKRTDNQKEEFIIPAFKNIKEDDFENSLISNTKKNTLHSLKRRLEYLENIKKMKSNISSVEEMFDELSKDEISPDKIDKLNKENVSVKKKDRDFYNENLGYKYLDQYLSIYEQNRGTNYLIDTTV